MFSAVLLTLIKSHPVRFLTNFLKFDDSGETVSYLVALVADDPLKCKKTPNISLKSGNQKKRVDLKKPALPVVKRAK